MSTCGLVSTVCPSIWSSPTAPFFDYLVSCWNNIKVQSAIWRCGLYRFVEISLLTCQQASNTRPWCTLLWSIYIWDLPNSYEGLVAHDCGYPLSRYTCRATRVAADFLDFIAFCRCSTGVALHPLKILVSHLSPPIPGSRRTEIWVWKGVALHGGVAGTVAGVALHCATKYEGGLNKSEQIQPRPESPEPFCVIILIMAACWHSAATTSGHASI